MAGEFTAVHRSRPDPERSSRVCRSRSARAGDKDSPRRLAGATPQVAAHFSGDDARSPRALTMNTLKPEAW